MVRHNTKTIRRIPKSKWRDITRKEYNALVEILNERGEILSDILKALDVQFQRIAQLQAELDVVRSAWTKNAHRRRPRR